MAKNSVIIEAIRLINPNAEVSVSNDDINTLVWHNETTPIPKADIEAKYTEAEEIVNKPQTLRASAKAKLMAGEALTQEEVDTIVW
tara:strand:+ start:193 stop:450 length:258 start_codon:yes stop_codon:yes gene_type:complete